jgi:hypothetical protein
LAVIGPPRSEVARKQRLFERPPESGRFFGINWNFGRLFQIEAMAQMAIAEPNRSHSALSVQGAASKRPAMTSGKTTGLNPHSPDNALSFGAACAIQI